MLVVANPTQDDQSAMDPDPHLEIVDQAAELEAIFIQVVLDIEGGADGCKSAWGSSSWVIGAPKKASTPSPREWAIVPS